ncbi:hypothetical protein LL033_10020 [Clostridium estertheticum]|uniref:hypothetical protein n=1 Tax=Clostridium estertheticum TaxID=238834 RepID=UPI001C0B11EB|nr:hypothetical protein [Clostridium estertheticum]MBU3217805.1 hypothetical protein [Clostridium estertheticum]WAG57492.1 hypothetical protein LL033_10020 [Clostridium estertheticum]
METSYNNPKSNIIGKGITEEAIIDAVNKSGYPLQTISASKLVKDFSITQEWSYVDKDTGALRTLDIFAQKDLYSHTEKHQHRVRPALNLLIECKQSELPYIFFLDTEITHAYNFPVIAGLVNENVRISSDDTISTYNLPILNVLEMDKHGFISKNPQFCLSFSKCARKGKELELSGTDAYNGLILPLSKAVESFKKTKIPPKTAYYFDADLVMPIGVVDAPMIGVIVSEGKNKMINIPWVRVLKHETNNSSDYLEREKTYAIDIIHKDFLETYINQHLLPFSNEFAKRMINHQHVIATGEGYIKGMDNNSFQNIESRLKRKPIISKGNRLKLIVKNFYNNIKGMSDV